MEWADAYNHVAMNARAPLITAIVLLLLPLLYVATYFANVQPAEDFALPYPYRWGGVWAARVYWPLEKTDRRLRPDSWGTWVDVGGPGSVSSFATSCGCYFGEEVSCVNDQCLIDLSSCLTDELCSIEP